MKLYSKIAMALLALSLFQPLACGTAMAQRVSDLPTLKMKKKQSQSPAKSMPKPAAQSAKPQIQPSIPLAPENAIMGERIAAVVNDEIISTSDIRARIGLVLLSSGLPKTPDVERHLLPQVLRGLIDERLQLQEGKKLDISVSSAEIENAMQKLAEDNRIPGGNMQAFLAANSIPESTLANQIRSAIVWSRVAQRTLRARAEVGDDEIDAAIERMRANAGKTEYLVSEIYLAVDNPADEDRIKQLAENLAGKIREGAPFGAVARQFSQSSSAASGGDIGWMQSGQLPADLDKALQSADVGRLIGPVRSTGGFYLLGIREKRSVASLPDAEETLVLRQLFAPFPGGGSNEKIFKEAENLRKSANSCEWLDKNLSRSFASWQSQDMGEVKLAELPSWLSDSVRKAAKGHAGEAIPTDKGAVLLFVCDRRKTDGVDRQAIAASIGSERMELMARRLLRDLRSNAYVDIRMDL